MSNPQGDPSTICYLSECRSAFSTLNKLWELWLDGSDGPVKNNKSQGFWHMANSLHAVMQYAEAIDAGLDEKDFSIIAWMLEESYKVISAVCHEAESIKYNYVWWDDFGHWGNASISAYYFLRKHPERTAQWGVKAEDFLESAVRCWCIMNAYSWNKLGWQGNASPDGCWNFVKGKPGAQHNSITNGSYLFMCMSIYEVGLGDDDALDKVIKYANTSYSNICDLTGDRNPNSSICLSTFKQAALDVFSWINGNKADWLGNASGGHGGLMVWEPYSIKTNSFGIQSPWSASQALWPAAISKLANASDGTEMPGESSSFIDGILENTPQLFHNDVLCETPFYSFLRKNPTDLGTGKGIFLRYLHYLEPLKVQPFVEKIRSTANAASKHKSAVFVGSAYIADVFDISWVSNEEYKQFACDFASWWGKSYVSYSNEWKIPGSALFSITRQTSGLSAMVAALRVENW